MKSPLFAKPKTYFHYLLSARCEMCWQFFALSITDGAFDEYPEERRREMIISITEIYERMLNEPPSTDSDCKNSPKVSK